MHKIGKVKGCTVYCVHPPIYVNSEQSRKGLNLKISQGFLKT